MKTHSNQAEFAGCKNDDIKNDSSKVDEDKQKSGKEKPSSTSHVQIKIVQKSGSPTQALICNTAAVQLLVSCVSLFYHNKSP